MAKYVVEKKGLGCFNLIIWDFLFAWLCGYGLFNGLNMHTFFSILLGLICGLIVMFILNFLMKLPIVGKIIQFALGGFWGYVVFFYFGIGELMKIFFGWDKIWYVSMGIICILIFGSIHIFSMREMTNGTGYDEIDL
jgi:hypothetical protein